MAASLNDDFSSWNDPFSSKLIASLAPGAEALAIVGSYANGGATSYSDLDILRFVPDADLHDLPAYQLKMMDGRLLSLTQKSFNSALAELRDPRVYYKAFLPLTEFRTLHDPGKNLTQFRISAASIGWEDLSADVDRYVNEQLCGLAEEATKVLSGIEQNSPERIIYGTQLLTLELPKLIYLHHRQCLRSESLYFIECQRLMGTVSAWSKHFRSTLSPVNGSTAEKAGRAVLELYLQTIDHTGSEFDATQKEVIAWISEQIRTLNHV